MFRKVFSLSNGALFVALVLSTIAAWYSIIGLTAIFAGAVVPIIIMGSALELAKITTTVWLRKYWYRCGLLYKMYLVPAVVLLALLTSMGIFGFLSKAHLDQNIGSGDVNAKVALLDEKIIIQRENIKANRAALAQMDTQVNDIMSKGDSERAVERSVTIRRQQANERAKLLKEIEIANTTIAKLNEERAPIASELRKVEAEVGPIKYIAALIYGDNPDANILERAVRWVIILLVIVFDPLAIMLVLAANQSKEWDENNDVEEENKLREKVEHEKIVETILEKEPVVEEPVILEVTNEEEEAFKALEPKEEKILDKHPYLNEHFSHFQNLTPIVHKPEVNEEEFTEVIDTKPEIQLIEIPEEINDITADQTVNIPDVERPGDYVTPPIEEKRKPEIKKIDGSYVLYDGKRTHIDALRSQHPELFLDADKPREPKTSFGTDFPIHAITSDIFVRVDSIPNRVFKYNGRTWVETNRSITDTYLSNNEYLQFLVEKISTGEYDPEMLTDQEQDAIAQYIKG